MEREVIDIDNAMMVFELKDGSLLRIQKQDVKRIANEIITEALLNPPTRIFIREDTIMNRVNVLLNILNTQKGLTDEIRIKYLEQILALSKSKFEVYDKDITDEIRKPK